MASNVTAAGAQRHSRVGSPSRFSRSTGIAFTVEKRALSALTGNSYWILGRRVVKIPNEKLEIITAPDSVF
jgi:hypothetical protein